MSAPDWRVFGELVETLLAASHPRLVLERLLAGLVKVLGASRGFVLLREEGEEGFVPVATHGRTETEDLALVSGTVCDRAIAAGAPLLIVDTHRDAELLSAASLATARQALSICCAPLVADGSTLGVVYLDMPRRPLVPEDGWHDLMASVTGLAAQLVADLRIRERLVAAQDRMTALSSLSFDDEGFVVGDGPEAQRVESLIRSAAPQDVTVLVTGETGTGKEMVARAIHRMSLRRCCPFVAVNCAALPQDLVEAELFGVEKGAYTGATEARPGRFELADGGTLFLDEVGDLPASTQVALLRVLQERTVSRLGGGAPRKLDLRLVCATNVDLEAAVSRGEFRRDLFFRINVFRIELPPLRGRPGVVLALARHFLTTLAARYGRRLKGFSPEALAILTSHDWPGNVRELRNAVERAVVVETSDTVRPDSLPLRPAPDPATEAAASFWAHLPQDYESAREAFERAFLERSLEANGGNVSAVARVTGLPRSTIYRRLEKYGIPVPEQEGAGKTGA